MLIGFIVSVFDGCARESQTFTLVYIVSVHLPPFLVIHLNPKACEDSRLTLFQRNSLLAYEVTDPRLYEVVNRYFIQHALS